MKENYDKAVLTEQLKAFCKKLVDKDDGLCGGDYCETCPISQVLEMMEAENETDQPSPMKQSLEAFRKTVQEAQELQPSSKADILSSLHEIENRIGFDTELAAEERANRGSTISSPITLDQVYNRVERYELLSGKFFAELKDALADVALLSQPIGVLDSALSPRQQATLREALGHVNEMVAHGCSVAQMSCFSHEICDFIQNFGVNKHPVTPAEYLVLSTSVSLYEALSAKTN